MVGLSVGANLPQMPATAYTCTPKQRATLGASNVNANFRLRPSIADGSTAVTNIQPPSGRLHLKVRLSVMVRAKHHHILQRCADQDDAHPTGLLRIQNVDVGSRSG